ncbi:multicomponent Na+:H+ antiporter subunit E [Caldalkalibacillus uzonensis]|uniref:Multicomponent Na+:H+ antiporter subunit E n=1 Tax=Caldalkalibacillus uzonensis TaxID=353224 RepID=A0ABU0CT31_9BACI|nr:Na+/H+ antiporter subunit E [Caldalkalibacillus uzonensis]MDQ0339580.1 multicomponent Na+:H+ antiporter subunit E [Caldalkalibacillus uzonensis]
MPFQILLNLILALIWVLLNNSWDLVTFSIGYVLGFLLIFALRRFLPYSFYGQKIVAVVKLLLLFLKELILSSISVIKQIIKPDLDIRPGIFAFETQLKSDWEITTLACLISLTPGTLTVSVTPDKSILYIHAIDIPDAEQTIAQIKDSFEQAIMEVSR